MSQDIAAFHQLETRITTLDSQAAEAWGEYQEALDEQDALRAARAAAEDREEHWGHCRALYQRWQDIEDEYDELVAKRNHLVCGEEVC